MPETYVNVLYRLIQKLSKETCNPTDKLILEMPFHPGKEVEKWAIYTSVIATCIQSPGGSSQVLDN